MLSLAVVHRLWALRNFNNYWLTYYKAKRTTEAKDSELSRALRLYNAVVRAVKTQLTLQQEI